MHLENRTATIGGYTGAADSMRRRNEEHTHRRSAAQRQPANTRSKSAGNGPMVGTESRYYPLPIIVDCYGLTLILLKYSNALCLFSKIRLDQQNIFAVISVSKGDVSLLIEDLIELANKICKQKASMPLFTATIAFIRRERRSKLTFSRTVSKFTAPEACMAG